MAEPIVATIHLDTSAFSNPDVALPQVLTVRHHAQAPVLEDPATAAAGAMRELLADPRLAPGSEVAVGVGSRGVANIPVIVRAVVTVLKDAGCRPFIVPAMGSHGGATAEGQREILASYGITPEGVGAEIRATMETVLAGTLDDGYPIYFDRIASQADAVVVVNRIKHHTDFAGEIESGLCKMCAIGLGKQKGAASIHRFGADGLRNIMPEVGRRLVAAMPVVGGIGIIENPYGQTAEIHAVPAAGIGRQQEIDLLNRARVLAPRLAFEALDVLIVDEMGKDISGSGLDTHVIGRVRMPSIAEESWDGPNVRMVCVTGLSRNTHGNAAGLGLADVVTKQLVDGIDWPATLTNHATSGEGGAHRQRVPIVAADAVECVRSAMTLCGRGKVETIRLARIRNTEHVTTLEVSPALWDECRNRDDIEIVGEPHDLALDALLGQAR